MLAMDSSILVLGSGGREHALARKLSDSPLAPRVFVAPGHCGIDMDPHIRGGSVAVDLSDHDDIVALCQRLHIALTIVGPELPLSQGIVDRFCKEGLPIVGPTRDAAQLEASKVFAKHVMDAAGIPTAAWQVFDDVDKGLELLASRSFPCVLKADGLAAGKGAFVVHTLAQARDVLQELMSERVLGEAGACVVCEDLLIGEELSFIVLTDGEHVRPLSTSKDYKKLMENDVGPNTGGMGAVTPSPDATPELAHRIHAEIVRPLLAEMQARKMPYSGFLYLGLMLTAQGPRVLEFNVRLGDPEAQALLWGMNADILPVLWALASDELSQDASDLSKGMASVCVVSASKGYPVSSSASVPIDGLEHVSSPDAVVYLAGVRGGDDARLHTHGGRVLGVTARAWSVEQARELAYAESKEVSWEGMQRREDIGK